MTHETPLLPSLRLVASMVRLHRWPFAVAVVGSIVFAAGTVGSTIVLGRVIDEIVLPELAADGNRSGGALWGGVLAVAIVTLIRAAGIVARRYYAGMTGARVKRTFRDRLGSQYLALPLEWRRTMPTGRLLAHTDADTEKAVEVLHPLPFTVGVSFMAVFAAISAVLVDPVMAAIGLVVFPLMVALNRLYSRLVEAPAARVQAAIGDVSALAHESFDGALIVKTLGRTEQESERFGRAVDHLRRERVGLGILRSAFHAAVESLPQLGIIAVTLAGVYRLDAGAVTAGDVVQMVSLFSVLAFPMTVFAFFLENLPPSVIAHRRVHDVLETTVPERPTRRTTTTDGPARLTALGIGLTFPDGTEVLHGIDIDVAPGETVAVVGSTGSGKSTLASVLAGLDGTTRGRVLLDGIDLAELDPADRTNQIAVAFQEPFLFADSVRANIDVEGDLPDEALRWATAVARVDGFIDDLPQGYGTVLGERGVSLSGGQRQRVALARALVRRPRLLVLDDATSAVDPRIELQILEGLRGDLDTTMVIVAQRLSTIELADRVLFLRDGTVRAIGPHDELLAESDYANLVTAYEQAAR